MKLSATKIKTAKATKKTQKLYDGEGLYLEITPKGSKRWRMRFRHNGKENTISLGLYPVVSLAQARDRHFTNRKLLDKGISPSEHKKVTKIQKEKQKTDTFKSIAREWYTLRKKSWADNYSGRVLSGLERDIFPWIGAKAITEIKTPELLKTIKRIEQRGANETAHRTLANCSNIFKHAISTGRAEIDPSDAIVKANLEPVTKGHMAAITDPPKVAELLRAMDCFTGTLVTRCAFLLAPLVFVRPGELRKAEWKDINLNKAEWRFLVTKTDTDHIVPLSTQAVEILREIEPLTGDGRYVFPGARTKSRPMSDAALLAALRRIGIEKSEMTIHGFRAMARTLLDEELGFRVDYIEHQLAHAVKDPNGRAYNRTKFLVERKALMQSWADYLDQLKNDSNVIPIKAKNRARQQ